MSDYSKVLTFTKEAGQSTPDTPQLFTKEEILFTTKMMLDEIMEFCATVMEPQEAKYSMIKMITDSKDIPKVQGTSVELIAEQVDALVDSYYYSLNACAKKGIDFSKVFNLVHDANMDKRDPTTGLFIKREDGKILKRPGWKAPRIDLEIQRQIEKDLEKGI
jgi:predicted HAD superfamily Cof-like phosphohydrolase